IETLGYYLDRALNAMIKKLNKLFVEHNIDLQHSQYTVLKVLWCKNGVSQSKLSKILGKDPAAVSRALNYLEQKGYIIRKSLNSKTNGIYLTDYANSRKEEIDHVADLITESATNSMTDYQREILTQLLTKIYYNTK
ncbi:MAG: MarR family transcriptional regulator, partial [Muribaculaceae bacterium]|nr:MarR family transcriptional regulator [Muribaculaceae bacterium]